MGTLIDRVDPGRVLDSLAVPVIETMMLLSDKQSVITYAPSGAATASRTGSPSSAWARELSTM